MAKQATIIVLLLVFVGAIFIHYVLTAVEGFKNKKRRNLKRKSGKRSPGKRSPGKRSPGKRSPGKRSPGKKRSGKRSPGRGRSGKKRSGKSRSGKKRSAKSPSAKSSSAKSSTTPYDNGMKFSDIVGSLLSPSLPDSRDLKDRLHAAVDDTIDQTPTTYTGGRKGVSSCSMEEPQGRNAHYDPSCSKYDNKKLACDSMPYIADMDDYIRKDNIPCYGCNLK